MQYHFLVSLIKEKDVLRWYSIREDPDSEKNDERKENHSRIIQAITNHNFLYNLEDIIEIFKPLHDYQITSESGNAYLGYIVKR